MAVPFAIPDEEISNLIRTVIFLLTQTRIARIEATNDLHQCMEELVRLLIGELERRSRFADYDNHLTRTLYLLRQSLEIYAPNNSHNSATQPQSTTTTTTMLRTRRSWGTTSKSNCDEEGAKIKSHLDIRQSSTMSTNGTTDDDYYCTQEDSVQKKKCLTRRGEDGLLSRLAPQVRRTLWTAFPLICMVGWHLFLTTYSM